MERRWVLTILSVLCAGEFAFAGSGVTYHGRLLKADNTPVNASVVQFKIEVRTPGPENCLMYSETHTLDMSTSDGVFAITINDGTASTVNTEPFTLDRAFQNRGTFSFGGGKCSMGNSYTPNASDGRKLAVAFNDGSFAGFENLPAQSINFIPMSMESITVGGYNAGSLLRVHDGAGAPAAISALTPVQYNTFLDLLAGTSPLFLNSTSSLNGSNLSAGSVDDTKLAGGITGTKISGNISGNAAGFTGSLNGDVTGTQTATVVGKIQGRAVDSAAPANGQVLKWNNGNNRWEPAADAAGTGTVTSVTGTGAVVMTGTATDPIVGVQDATASVKGVVQLSANGGTTAGQAVQANDSRLSDSRAPTAHHHDVDEIDSAASKYFTYKPNNSACANNEVLKWDNGNSRWICSTVGSLVSSEATTASNVGTAGVGVFKQLSTYDLQFKKLNAPSSALSLTDDTVNNKIDIAVNAELAGLSTLSSNGFVKRTAAGTYSPVASIGLDDMNVSGVFTNNTGLIVTDGTQLQNKACAAGEILKWNAVSGWTCSADAGLTSESDPKIGSNTTNYVSKWNGTALVASGIFESSGAVGIGTASPAQPGGLHIGDGSGLGFVTSVNNNHLTSNAYWDGTSWKYIAANKASQFVTGQDGSMVIRTTNTTGAANGAITWTPAISISAAANVGIGGASSGPRFQVTSTDVGSSMGAQTVYTPALTATSASNFHGQWSELVLNTNQIMNGTGYGAVNRVSISGAAASTLTGATGSINDANNGTPETITTAVGAHGLANNYSTGTIGTGIGLEASVNNIGAGTITTGIGLRINNIAGTTKYAIYQGDSAAKTYLNGSVAIGTTTPAGKLTVAGAMVSTPTNVASGATVDLSGSNTITLASVGGSAITLQNMVHGGMYTLVVQDTTSRTYTFTGCNTSKFKPGNAATTAGSHTIYTILTVYNGSTYDCYVTWGSGYL